MKFLTLLRSQFIVACTTCGARITRSVCRLSLCPSCCSPVCKALCTFRTVSPRMPRLTAHQFYIPLATIRRTRSTKFCRVFAFMIVLCFRGVFEGARRNGTICLAQFNHFRGEKHNCLLPLPLSWCYACCVCCASCVFRSGASESASGSLPTRSTRSAGAKRITPIIPPPIFFLPCFHPCTLPHTCTGSQWN